MSTMNHINVSSCRVRTLNLEEEMNLDFINGRGVLINSIDAFDKKNKNARIMNGLQSEFFGTDFSSDNAFKERYACKCKKYIGKAYDGEVCDVCNSRVEYVEIDLTRTGWIVLDDYHMLSPIYYAKIADALGKFEDERIIDKIMDVEYYDSTRNVQYSDKELAILKKHPFIKKGARWFKDNFLEVITFYEKKKPNKLKLFTEIRNNMDNVWTKALPVYTSLLRTEMPGEKGGKDFKLKINTHYRSIIRCINEINNINTISYEYDEGLMSLMGTKIDKYLAAVHKDIYMIFTCTFNDLTDKNGIITSKVLGGRYNFSCRNVIIPGCATLRSDEIELGYIPFMELFRYELQNEYAKIYGATPSQADNAWKKACNKFDEKYYSIANHMIKDKSYQKHLNVLISRNPCINYGSFIVVRIVKVKPEFNDKTMAISSRIIVPMNADFDGDELNIFRIIGEDMYRRFSKNLNPRLNLFVSRMTGKINHETMPNKDENVAFLAFNTM